MDTTPIKQNSQKLQKNNFEELSPMITRPDNQAVIHSQNLVSIDTTSSLFSKKSDNNLISFKKGSSKNRKNEAGYKETKTANRYSQEITPAKFESTKGTVGYHEKALTVKGGEGGIKKSFQIRNKNWDLRSRGESQIQSRYDTEKGGDANLEEYLAAESQDTTLNDSDCNNLNDKSNTASRNKQVATPSTPLDENNDMAMQGRIDTPAPNSGNNSFTLYNANGGDPQALKTSPNIYLNQRHQQYSKPENSEFVHPFKKQRPSSNSNSNKENEITSIKFPSNKIKSIQESEVLEEGVIPTDPSITSSTNPNNTLSSCLPSLIESNQSSAQKRFGDCSKSTIKPNNETLRTSSGSTNHLRNLLESDKKKFSTPTANTSPCQGYNGRFYSSEVDVYPPALYSPKGIPCTLYQAIDLRIVPGDGGGDPASIAERTIHQSYFCFYFVCQNKRLSSYTLDLMSEIIFGVGYQNLEDFDHLPSQQQKQQDSKFKRERDTKGRKILKKNDIIEIVIPDSFTSGFGNDSQKSDKSRSKLPRIIFEVGACTPKVFKAIFQNLNFQPKKYLKYELSKIRDDSQRMMGINDLGIRNIHSYLVVDGDESFFTFRVVDIDKNNSREKSEISGIVNTTLNVVWVTGKTKVYIEPEGHLKNFDSMSEKYNWSLLHILENLLSKPKEIIRIIKNNIRLQSLVELYMVELQLKIRSKLHKFQDLLKVKYRKTNNDSSENLSSSSLIMKKSLNIYDQEFDPKSIPITKNEKNGENEAIYSFLWRSITSEEINQLEVLLELEIPKEYSKLKKVNLQKQGPLSNLIEEVRPKLAISFKLLSTFYPQNLILTAESDLDEQVRQGKGCQVQKIELQKLLDNMVQQEEQGNQIYGNFEDSEQDLDMLEESLLDDTINQDTLDQIEIERDLSDNINSEEQNGELTSRMDLSKISEEETLINTLSNELDDSRDET